MENFQSLGLPQNLLDALDQLAFVKPTPIQATAIPLALEGRDILGTAQTGTGKTGAFGIPLIARLLNNPNQAALVLTPTRELAVQVMTMLMKFVTPANAIRGAVLIGGEPMPKQFQQLKFNPRLIVGTPGRINDHLLRGSLTLGKVGVLVLDEMDRMLDMGFGVQLEQIADYLPEKRQTMMFSATLPPDIVKASKKYLQNPERIAAGSTTATASRVSQEMLHVSETEKYPQLLTELSRREGSVIVFVKTKWNADKLADKLSKENHQAQAIHGDLRQGQRDRVIRHFREKKYRIMVATDIAARGLDIPHIEHVINYDLPQCPEDYIHRIGRTARAGAEGAAVNLIAPIDREKWRAIHRLLNPNEQQDSKSSGGRFDDRRGSRPKSDRSFKKKKNDFYAAKDKKKAYDSSETRDEKSFAGHAFDPAARPAYAPQSAHDDTKPKASWDKKPKAFGKKPKAYGDYAKPKAHDDYAKSKGFSDSKPKAYDVDSKPKAFEGEAKPKSFHGPRAGKRGFEDSANSQERSAPQERKGYPKFSKDGPSKAGPSKAGFGKAGYRKPQRAVEGEGAPSSRFENTPKERRMSHPQNRNARQDGAQQDRGASSSYGSSRGPARGNASAGGPKKTYKTPYAGDAAKAAPKKGYLKRKKSFNS